MARKPAPPKTDSAKSEISERLAARVRDARKARGLSLDALAKLSGVSRSMLSQIERGESSPTVSSLWNLAQALKLDLAHLLGEAPAERGALLELVRADQTPVIQSKGSGCAIRILSPPDAVGDTEVYDLAFEAGGSLASDGHRAGAVEHVTVVSGALRFDADGAGADLAAGDTARYRADAPHTLSAPSGPARALLIVRDG